MLSLFRFRCLVSCALFHGVMTAKRKLSGSKSCVFKNDFRGVTLFHLVEGTLSGENQGGADGVCSFPENKQQASRRVHPQTRASASDLEFSCLSPTPLRLIIIKQLANAIDCGSDVLERTGSCRDYSQAVRWSLTLDSD